MQRIVLIPAYEPDNNLIELVNRLSKENLSIIIVDDGSGEKYNYIFDSLKDKVRIISYKNNKGKGYALKKGLKFINKNINEDYIVVTMDSDGQHTVKDAMKLCNYVENNPEKLVLGKRIRNKNTPLRSRMGNGITKVIYRISTGINLYDTQTGLRAFSNKLTNKMLNIEGNRYEYEMNVLLNLPREGIKIEEIEIKTIYIDNNSGSHFNTVKDSFRIYKQIIKFSFSSFVGFIIDYILYSILMLLTNNLVLANIMARVVSSTSNYTINRKLVFKNKGKVYKSASQYFILAIIILGLNTMCLNLLTNVIGMNAFVSKIVVEMLLFIFSYIIQNKIIFKIKGVKKRQCLKSMVLQ